MAMTITVLIPDVPFFPFLRRFRVVMNYSGPLPSVEEHVEVIRLLG
jgi:hypothetical protein